MDKAKVYFSDLRAGDGISLPDKLKNLIERAGMGTIDFKGKFTAIKIHFGELGNMAFLRPNYAKTVADFITGLGGKPFLTDCSTLYPGSRKNALDHLDTAYVNGFSPISAGCQILIADGLKGNDDIAVPVPGGEHVKEAYIGRVIMDADIIITLNHFKGHELTGFGGAIKNLGMGCGSKSGKKEMHSAGKPRIDADLCVGCGLCLAECAHDAISLAGGKAAITESVCAGCGRCIGACVQDAVVSPDDERMDIAGRKIAEYAKAVLNGRPAFHISLAIDISPLCDCYGHNDLPIVPDVGMFASFDPVALDKACADACNRQPSLTGGLPGCDHFKHTHPDTDWKGCLAHAQKLAVGTVEYEMIEV